MVHSVADQPSRPRPFPAPCTVLLAFLITLAFLVRLAPLGRYVTPDEPAWVYRAALFADALAGRAGASFPVTGHPGVTTMWLGAAGIAVQRLLSPAASAAHLDWLRNLVWLAPENAAAFRHLAFFLPAGRIAVALVTTLGILAASLLAARAFDWLVALLLAGLLTFEPFLVGHSGLLHTDALLSTFSLLALLAAWNSRTWRPLLWSALAGLCAGLALLTKTPAIIVAAFAGGMVVGRGREGERGRGGDKGRGRQEDKERGRQEDKERGTQGDNERKSDEQHAIRDKRYAIRDTRYAIRDTRYALRGAIYLATLALTVFALYPALWSDPLGVVRTLGGFAERHVESVQRPIFFLGEWAYDPGPAFYPLVFFFRASPVVLLGLGLGLVRLRRMPADRRRAFLILLAFALLYGAAMSVGAKKHDRYLLPVFPPLALAAAIAYRLLPIAYRLSRIAYRVSPGARRASPIPPSPGLLVPVALQLLLLLPFVTCPLGYANPLLGGPPVAAHVLSLDWGEGAGAAARWLNRVEDADQLTVAAVSIPSFAALFAGRTVPLEQADLADYVVQTAAEEDAAVVHTVRLGFFDRAVIVSGTTWLEQADFLRQHARADDLILLDADSPLLRRYDGPGVLRSAADLPDEAAVAAWLAEQLPPRSTVWLVASPGASPITALHLRRQLEAVAEPLQSADSITLFAVRFSPALPAPAPYRAVFGGQLALVDSALPPSAAWPDPLAVTLRWRALTTPASDCRALLSLRDQAGSQWASIEWPLLNESDFATSAWTAGEWADARYVLRLPPGIPPGEYAVEVSLYDGAGAALAAVAPDGAFRGLRLRLGNLAVTPPSSPPDRAALDIPQALDIELADLLLLGQRPIPTQLFSGDHLDVALFWEAPLAPRAAYSVTLELADADGNAVLTTTMPLSPHPTWRWRAGDRFESRYRLHVLPAVPPVTYRLLVRVTNAAGAAVGKAALGQVTVLPRERSFTLPAIPQPLEVAFGPFVHLRGYGLATATATPGSSLPLTLIWQADGPAAEDYTLFVHLLGADGLPHGQIDWLDAAAPPSSWAAGQVIVNRLELPVATDAPPGIYRIAIGFYDAAYGDRLPIREAEGALVGDLFVLPVEIVVTGGTP